MHPMMPHTHVFKAMLEQMDCNVMAQHSMLNHHASCMDYLCAHRSDKLTVKLYLIEKPTNENLPYLVSPHSHRYAFYSTMLHGRLCHIRFKEVAPDKHNQWNKFEYSPETRTGDGLAVVGLEKVDRALCYTHENYFVKEDEIHTLQMIERDEEPVLIGLIQLGDTRQKSNLYVNAEVPEVVYPNYTTPTVEQAERLRKRCLELIGNK